MSYDLMVFNKAAAPRSRAEFMKWYEAQTEWKEEHDYADPANTSPELRNWYMEMLHTFPPMNGPFASEDDEGSNVSDYTVGRDVIYVAFAWSVADEAYKTMRELAEKHAVGFFDVSRDKGDILFPENGKLVSISNARKNVNPVNDEHEGRPWWKFWS